MTRLRGRDRDIRDFRRYGFRVIDVGTGRPRHGEGVHRPQTGFVQLRVRHFVRAAAAFRDILTGGVIIVNVHDGANLSDAPAVSDASGSLTPYRQVNVGSVGDNGCVLRRFPVQGFATVRDARSGRDKDSERLRFGNVKAYRTDGAFRRTSGLLKVQFRHGVEIRALGAGRKILIGGVIEFRVGVEEQGRDPLNEQLLRACGMYGRPSQILISGGHDGHQRGNVRVHKLIFRVPTHLEFPPPLPAAWFRYCRF